MMTPSWEKVKEYCIKNNLNFNQFGGTFNLHSKKNKSVLENIILIQNSIIAPAIQTDWQVEHKYIPCRIFKNISYGKMGVTNNPTVNKLFNNKLICNKNIEELLSSSILFEKKNIKDKINIIKELMIEVRDKHTYINRCKFILEYVNKHFSTNC